MPITALFLYQPLISVSLVDDEMADKILPDLFAMFVVCGNAFDIQQHEEERTFGSFGSFSLQGDYRMKGVFFKRSAIRPQDYGEAVVPGDGRESHVDCSVYPLCSALFAIKGGGVALLGRQLLE